MVTFLAHLHLITFEFLDFLIKSVGHILLVRFLYILNPPQLKWSYGCRNDSGFLKEFFEQLSVMNDMFFHSFEVILSLAARRLLDSCSQNRNCCICSTWTTRPNWAGGGLQDPFSWSTRRFLLVRKLFLPFALWNSFPLSWTSSPSVKLVFLYERWNMHLSFCFIKFLRQMVSFS